MRILRVADVPDNRTGGMSRLMHFTSDVMREAGHQVDFLWSEDLGRSGPRRLRRFVVPARLPGLIRRKQISQGWAYDVVELHEPLTAPYCLARRFGVGLPPVVAMSHGVESRGHAMTLRYYQAKGRPVPFLRRLSPRSVTAQADYGLRRCDQVICLNREDEEYLRRVGVPAGRIARTHTGVSRSFLDAGRASLTTPEPRKGLLFLAGWLERKGTLDLVPAVSRVLQDHPGLRFTVAGCGVPAERVLSEFPSEVRPRVDVFPVVTGEEALVGLYRRHAVFVLPSFFEGQPLSMLEAAATALPSVTTDICGMRDFIRHEENGLLVRPGKPGDLAASLDRLIRGEGFARRLGGAAQRDVQAMTYDSAAAAMLEAYRRAAEASGTRQ